MENLLQKAAFLRSEYTMVLARLAPDTHRKWGKMIVLQMIEHMGDYVRIANGKTRHDIVSPADMLPKMQGFLASEKPFRENTPNALMADEPSPVKHLSVADAINELQAELDHFFVVHESEQGRVTPNPFFGNLVYDQQIQLLHKHATHHLRQFGLNY